MLEKATFDLQFKELIEKLHEKYGKEVVLLVDEYDKPTTDYLDDMPKAKETRDILKAFTPFSSKPTSTCAWFSSPGSAVSAEFLFFRS